MDPKTQMPDIKAEVNKVDDGGKKKASGLLGLFGGGGGGAAGGLGGLGAGAVGGGGLLATKAGMLALVLMGSAVAGGIGLAGYKMFGPGDADRTGGNLSLFAPKPQQAASDAAAPAGDGSSASLTMMAQSAAKDKAAEDAEAAAAAAAAAPTDNTAGDPAKDAAAADAARREAEARAASGGAINSGGGSGAAGSMGRGLANVRKLGALSSSTGGGATTSASSGSAGRLGDNLANAARNGASSAFSKGGPGAKASGARSMAARGGRGARGQARAVMGDQANGRAGSSFAAGKTYDGSTAGGGGAIGPDGGAIGMDGADTGTGAQPKSIAANSARNTREQDPPIPKMKEMVTPWAAACQRALMLTMLAAALAFAASKIPPGPYTKIIVMAIGAAIIAIGGYIGVLAGQIMSGPYGQKNQGMVAAAASLGVIATGIGVMIGGSKSEAPTKEVAGTGTPPTGGTPATPGSNGLDIMGNPMVLIGGGLAVVSAIGLMFMPKPKPVEIEEGQRKPDVRYEARPNPARYMV